MRNPSIGLTESGFAILPSVLSDTECDGLDDVLQRRPLGNAGSRNLLDSPWCAALSVRLRSSPVLEQLVSPLVAVQCTYFDKNPEVNWLVSVHQDLSIPVKARIDGCGLTGWNVKEGRTFVQAPVDLLENLIAVRLHLDDSGPDNGPLRVVPRSHLLGRLPSDVQAARRLEFGEVECHVPRGGALFMRPLLLHASSKTTGTRPRRVLHFLFGPKELPFGLEWALTV
jgi:hypothetical protein